MEAPIFRPLIGIFRFDQQNDIKFPNQTNGPTANPRGIFVAMHRHRVPYAMVLRGLRYCAHDAMNDAPDDPSGNHYSLGLRWTHSIWTVNGDDLPGEAIAIASPQRVPRLTADFNPLVLLDVPLQIEPQEIFVGVACELTYGAERQSGRFKGAREFSGRLPRRSDIGMPANHDHVDLVYVTGTGMDEFRWTNLENLPLSSNMGAGWCGMGNATSGAIGSVPGVDGSLAQAAVGLVQ